MKEVYSHVKAIIKKDHNFLIIQTKLPNGLLLWDLPGGKVDFGEDPHDSLIREAEEEVRLAIKIIKSVGVYWFFRHDGHQAICSTFLCEINSSGEVDLTKNPADENITKYKWVTKEELLGDKYKVGHESLKELIKKI